MHIAIKNKNIVAKGNLTNEKGEIVVPEGCEVVGVDSLLNSHLLNEHLMEELEVVGNAIGVKE